MQDNPMDSAPPPLFAPISVEQQERHMELLSAMNRLGQSVLSSLDLDKVLQQVVDDLTRLLPSGEISILLLEGPELVFAALGGRSVTRLRGYRMPATAGAAGEVIRTGKPLCIPDVNQYPALYLDATRIAGYQPQGLLAVPLHRQGEIFGLIEAVYEAPNTISEEHAKLLEMGAQWAALAIHNARQHAEQGHRLRQLQILYEINLALGGTLDLETILKQIVEAAPILIPSAHRAAIFLLNAPDQVMELVAVTGQPIELPGRRSMWIDQEVSANVLKRGAVLYLPDVSQDPRYIPQPEFPDTRSLLIAPLESGPRRLGTIDLQSKNPGAFTPNDERVLGLFASQVSIAVENARLYRELQNALRQEQDTREQLVLADKLSSLGRMVATVAHELNNPLQSLRNCIYIARQPARERESREHYLDMAAGEMDRLSNLIAQLRTVYQPENVQALPAEPVARLVDEVCELVKPHLAKHQVEWRRTIEPEMKEVRVPAQFKQVLINLALNAVDAMQPDGGKLDVRVERFPRGNALGISFHDTGCGIAPEDQPHIFEPFYTTKRSGMGLGLAICYDIVHSHGGQLLVLSRIGVGSTFTVWLPLKSGDPDMP
ncbi:MAG: GAF domain-containing protein [Anaerolineae bacterium]